MPKLPKLPARSTVLDVLAIIAGALCVGGILFVAFGLIVGVASGLGFLFVIRALVTVWNRS